LDILVKDGILKQTDGIVIIISKSDYMPDDKDRKEIASEYLYDRYRNFTNSLEELLRTYRINRATDYQPYVIPFSLGKFMLGRTFTYIPDDSAIMVNTLLVLSRVKKKKGLW
jgi:hypothetical protein